MIKKEMVQEIYDRSKGKLKRKDIQLIIEMEKEIIKEQVKLGNKVTYVDFGVYESKKRAQKKGKNPHTKEDMIIKEKMKPNFRPAKSFKALVDKKK